MSRKPSLRIPQTTKRSEPALSLVFAEPAQSPPTAGASDRLQRRAPSAARDAMPPIPHKRPSDTRSLREPTVKKRLSLAFSPPATTSAVTTETITREPPSTTPPSLNSLEQHITPPAPVPAPPTELAETASLAEWTRAPQRSGSRWHTFGAKRTLDVTSSTVPDRPAPVASVAPKSLDTRPQDLVVSADPVTSTGPPSEPLPIPAREAVATSGTSASPGKSGWFASRKPAAPTAIQPVAEERVLQQPLSQSPAAASVPLPTTDVAVAASQPVEVPASSKKRESSRGWLGSLSRTSANASSSSLPMEVESSSPVAPKPPVAAVAPTEQSTVIHSYTPGRYAIGIPLLGRQKIPIEVLAPVKEPREDIMIVPPTEDVDQGIPTPVEAAGKEVSKRQERQESSWFGYLWSAPEPPATVSLPASPAKPVLEVPPSPTVSVPDLPSTTVERPTAPSDPRVSQGSWFSPWGWYAQPASTQPGSEGLPTAAAAASDGPAPTAETTPADALSASPTAEGPNLLLRTPEQRASWVSFFATRGRTPARKMHSEAGVEAMDIEDVEDVVINGPSTAAGPSKKPPAKPITDSDSIREKVSNARGKDSSPTPSKSSIGGSSTPKKAATTTVSGVPNLVLPSFDDTFKNGPRTSAPPVSSALRRTIGMVRNTLFTREEDQTNILRKSVLAFEGHKRGDRRWARQLPRMWDVLSGAKNPTGDVAALLQGCKRVAIIGIHGWFPGAMAQRLFGEPTGTSTKFANMMEAAVVQYMAQHGHKADRITAMPLEGDGTIERRVEKLYLDLMEHEDWVDDLHEADVVFVATHSQGSVASTHLLARLIKEGHIRLASDETGTSPAVPTMPSWAGWTEQRVCCLSLCGIHLGPLIYLHNSSVVLPYLQYFESAAAKELFEFQDITSAVSRKYMDALKSVLDHGVRFVYIASLDDQVVPIYSGVFTSINHPGIVRSLYLDGDSYSTNDFLSNLLILLLRLRNAGIDDAGLIAHLSEATAGSLNGVGHSTAYEELGTYTLAVRYMFECSGVLNGPAELSVEPFLPRAPRNDYEIPWALRHILADPRVGELFSAEFLELRAAFDDWQPKTAALKDIRRKLEPIRRLPNSRL